MYVYVRPVEKTEEIPTTFHTIKEESESLGMNTFY